MAFCDVAGFASLARPLIRLSAVDFQLFPAAFVEFFVPPEVVDGLFGFLAVFFAGPAEAVGDLWLECLVAFHGDGFHAAFDFFGSECFVPSHVHVGSGDFEPSIVDLRAHGKRVAAVAAMAIHLKPIEWQGPSDLAVEVGIFGAAADDTAVIDVDISDVDGVLVEPVVAVVRQAMAADRAIEMASFHKVEPQGTDAKCHIDQRWDSQVDVTFGIGAKCHIDL